MGANFITGIDVVFIHSDNPELREWYADKVGMEPGDGDPHWQEFVMPIVRQHRV